MAVLIEFRRRKSHTARSARRNSGSRIRVHAAQNFGYSANQPAWYARYVKPIDPKLRVHLAHAARDRRHHALPILHSSGVRSQLVIPGQIVKPKCVSARAPLTVAADGDHEWPVSAFEELVWNEVRVRVSPSSRIAA